MTRFMLAMYGTVMLQLAAGELHPSLYIIAPAVIAVAAAVYAGYYVLTYAAATDGLFKQLLIFGWGPEELQTGTRKAKALAARSAAVFVLALLCLVGYTQLDPVSYEIAIIWGTLVLLVILIAWSFISPD